MLPGTDALLATPDATPSLAGAAFRVALAVGAMLAAGWAWLYWQRKIRAPHRNLEVLERAMLARGAGVALLRVENRRLLVGVSSDGVRLLRDLDEGDATPHEPPFSEMLESASIGGELTP